MQRSEKGVTLNGKIKLLSNEDNTVLGDSKAYTKETFFNTSSQWL